MDRSHKHNIKPENLEIRNKRMHDLYQAQKMQH